MRTIIILLIAGIVALSSCRVGKVKTGCPTPRKNWGAEKVLDDMSKPKKKKFLGLF
ncbi:hypothetical protein KTO58_25685 [Chitinophaga pendula]|uniref:hypothetical protein n=1 Tax=Chitinophaga TaxID=79328 RepID=UPI0012FE17D8|nr:MULTISPECIES: hypothetical protein [Chitinophaga]UCJ07018.1 hypothetical protein KTO58_25685 [Chitinophaga pendula]